MATFTYTPSFTSSLVENPNIIAAKFGDGYEQVAYAGINKHLRVFNFGFSDITQAAADNILNFFKNNNTAITPFDYTPPDGVAGRFKCKKYKTNYISSNIVTVTCVFEEVFW